MFFDDSSFSQIKLSDFWTLYPHVTSELFCDALRKREIACYFLTNDPRTKTLYITNNAQTDVDTDKYNCSIDDDTQAKLKHIWHKAGKGELGILWTIDALHNPKQALTNIKKRIAVLGV